ncbi:MAG: hypothetical protein P4M13_01390 [Alphaproteobacteria bacterium]|nr:hypothetical protein [Alphaproteobacteria bacterium]
MAGVGAHKIAKSKNPVRSYSFNLLPEAQTEGRKVDPGTITNGLFNYVCDYLKTSPMKIRNGYIWSKKDRRWHKLPRRVWLRLQWEHALKRQQQKPQEEKGHNSPHSFSTNP